MRNGHLNLVIRGRKKIETTIEQKLNDGEWHRIILLSNNKILNVEVVVSADAQSTLIKTVKMPRRISVSNTLYVGGLMASTITLSPEIMSKLEPFKGCIRRFKVNNSTQDLARPGHHSNIGQCFPNVEKGSYFPGDAFAVYSKNLLFFDLFNVSFDEI